MKRTHTLFRHQSRERHLFSRHWFRHLTLLCTVMLAASTAPAPTSGAVSEPEITPREAGLLQQAAKLAESDPAKAYQFLSREAGASASAAMDFAVGVYATQSANTDQALLAYRSAVAKDPQFDRARRQLASALLQAEQYAEAAVELRVLLDRDAEDKPELWKALGFALLAQQRLTAAETAYRQALTYSPTDTAAMRGVLQVMLAQGRLAEARAVAREALRQVPDEVVYWNVMAQTALESNEIQQALTALESARRLGLLDEEGLAALAALYLNHNMPDEAFIIFNEMLDDTAEKIPAGRLLQAADALLRLNRQAEAAELLNRIEQAEERPATPADTLKAGLLRARLLYGSGEHERSIAMLQALLREFPVNGDLLLELGTQLRAASRTEEAGIVLQRAAKLPDVRAVALLQLAQAALDDGKFAQAADFLAESLRDRPDPAVERFLHEVRQAAAGQ
jgi:tetratricopeptide (TPR) repeat protein